MQTWNELMEDLRDEYTLSIKDVCMLLKSDRSWVNKYIRPHCRTRYINSNIRGDVRVGQNWMKIASKVLGKEITESIFNLLHLEILK